MYKKSASTHEDSVYSFVKPPIFSSLLHFAIKSPRNKQSFLVLPLFVSAALGKFEIKSPRNKQSFVFQIPMVVAEIFLTTFITVLFEKLASGDLIKLARSAGISSELENWKITLSQIQAVLVDAGQKHITQIAVQHWLHSLQHLAYDIDNLLDDLGTEVMRRQLNKGFDASAGTSTNKSSGVVSFEEAEDVRNNTTSSSSFLLPQSLTSLRIDYFEDLESVSQGLQHLTCLEKLATWSCPKLRDLPEKLLPSLSFLRVRNCRKLEKRCRSGTGKYWPIISQIPHLDV